MSGHSKWSQIKRQKTAGDIKKGQIFSKLSNAITIAVKRGGSADPETNFRLRLVIDQAKQANMPKDNIERAIQRGLGREGGTMLEEVVYEGYGPAGIAIIAEAVTDNRNRTTADVKRVVERGGGSLAGPGAVSWMFDREGMITVKTNGKGVDEILETASEADASDLEEEKDVVFVYTRAENLENVKKSLTRKGLLIESAELSFKPKNVVKIEDPQTAQKILNLMENLESLDDVQKVYSNFDIPDKLLEGMKSS